MFEALDSFDLDSIAEYVRRLQNEDGSFGGDVSSESFLFESAVGIMEDIHFIDEVDTRFSFCAVATLYLIDRIHVIDVEKAVQYVLSCYNFDGGFGTRPGSESHAGQVRFFFQNHFMRFPYSLQGWIYMEGKHIYEFRTVYLC